MRLYYIEILLPTDTPDDVQRHECARAAQKLRDVGIAASAVAIDIPAPIPEIAPPRMPGQVIPFYRPVSR